MTTIRIAGGWYATALPGFHYAAIVPMASHVATSQGDIPYPPGDEPLFLDLTLVGGFRLAGKGHSSNSSWEWIDGQWWRLGPACGNFSLIYDRLGVLHLSDCSQGVNGWRYVDDAGRLVSGDETYAGHGLNEYTEVAPNLWIGQGTGGGVVVNDAGTLRLLEIGECYAVKARREGDAVAIAFYTVARDGLSATIVQTTIAELRGLPIVPIFTPEPEPPEPEPRPPVPPKEPPTMPQLPNLHQWTIDEWPQVMNARRAALGDPGWAPDPEWVILQMARRYGLGLAPGEAPWPLQKMIAHEQGQGQPGPSVPP